MVSIKGGVEFTGNPDEVVLVSPDTVLASIPPELTQTRYIFENTVGHSFPAQYLRRKDLWDYTLQAWARYHLPQMFYATETFYNAMYWFLNGDDIKLTDPESNPDAIGFWKVTATGCCYYETTSEADPCLDKYHIYVDSKSYVGRRPFTRKAIPYPGPCKQDRQLWETFESGPGGQGTGDWQWTGRCEPTGSTGYHLPGGVSIEGITIEVSEGGLIYVSPPELPPGLDLPPPLVGRVVDYGPPGPQGPPGPVGPPGDGVTPESFVGASCSLNPSQLHSAQSCLGIVPDAMTPADLLPAFVAAGTETVTGIATQIVEKAPDVVFPQPELVITESGEPAFEAVTGASGKLLYRLSLPIALLIGLKMLLEDVYVVSCDDGNAKVPKRIPFPVLSFQDQSQKEVFQEIFRQFSYLLQCCAPCDVEPWVFWKSATGSQTFAFPYEVSAISLRMGSFPTPEMNGWYGGMQIHKLGEVRWIYKHSPSVGIPNAANEHGTLLFWNSINQNFYLPGQNIVGFELDQEYDKSYEVWLLPLRHEAHGLRL